MGKVINRICSIFKLCKFHKHGKKCWVGRRVRGTLKNVTIGDDCHIGDDNLLLSLLAPIVIGNHFMSGPNVMFITGNHRTDVIGKYMTEIGNKEKRKEDDLPIVVEDDVWIGAGAIILKGVTIGEGAVVGAGAVVTNNVPPYSIVAGIPAKVIKMRFNNEELLKHKKMLSR